jgi:hypothetical protein
LADRPSKAWVAVTVTTFGPDFFQKRNILDLDLNLGGQEC